MANYQEIRCNKMQQDAMELSEALTNIPATIEQLQITMRNLSRCWEGAAWAAFQTDVNKNIKNMEETYKKLVELQKALATGREKYLRAEFDIYTDIKTLWI